MIIDYGKSIFLVYQSEGNGYRHECTGVSVGTMFLPKDLINRKAQNGMKIDIRKKNEFESEFYFQK